MSYDMYGNPMYDFVPMRDATKFLEPIEVLRIGDEKSEYYQQPRKIKEETKEEKNKKKKEAADKVKKDAIEQEKLKKKKNDDFVEANLKKRINESAEARAKEPQQAQARASSSTSESTTSAPIGKPLTASTAPLASASLASASLASAPLASAPIVPTPPGVIKPPTEYKRGDYVTFDYIGEPANENPSGAVEDKSFIYTDTGNITMTTTNLSDKVVTYKIINDKGREFNISSNLINDNRIQYFGERTDIPEKIGITGIAPKPSAPTATIAANGIDFINLDDKPAGSNSLVFKQGDKYIKYIIEIENLTEKEVIEYLNSQDKAHEYTCATVVNKIPNTTVITNKKNQKLIEDWIKPRITKKNEKINDLLEITMEPCGITLMDYFKNNAKITDGKITSIILKTLAAINFLHSKKVCHNDITQANILIEDNPAAANIKIRIIDFGKSQLDCSNKDDQNKDLYDLMIIFDSFRSKLQDASPLKDKLQTILTYIETNKNDLFGKFAINDDLTLKTTSGGKKKYFSKKYQKTRKIKRSKYVNKKYRKTHKKNYRK